MKTHVLLKEYDHLSPAGAEVRLLLGTSLGAIAHCTLPFGKTSRAVQHQTVSEVWHVIGGMGEIWRKNNKGAEITALKPGVTIDIEVGTLFQYCSLDAGDLVFICMTTPPWPGANEAIHAKESAWPPNL